MEKTGPEKKDAGSNGAESSAAPSESKKSGSNEKLLPESKKSVQDSKKPIKLVSNVLKSIILHPKSAENLRESQSESRCLTAEEPTMIVPDLPETVITEGKSPKVLIWKELVVSVPVMSQKSPWQKMKSLFKKEENQGRRQVLHGVSGIAEPGEVLAIMGESGAGKTTLMNVLTQRNLKSLAIEGEVTINGEDLSPNELQRISSYVQQADLFTSSMTVHEHLMFSARLRMGSRFTSAEKKARVEQLIVQMNLVSCANTIISPRFGKSISLGEKKRLSFACEMLTNPSILFCDEPTSGLDAFMAKQVLKALKDLAKQGKTIILTIHQPSSQVFDLFDKLCLMAVGDIVYLGPAKKVRGIFKKAGYPLRGRDNPAEFCIGMLAHHQDETEEDRKDRIQKIQDAYNDSNMACLYKKRIFGPTSERRRKFGNDDIRTGERYAAGWFSQLLWLTIRSFRATLRDPLLLKIRLFQTIVTSVVVGAVYFQTELKPATIMTFCGFLFNASRDSAFLFLFPCVVVFTDEMPIFLRESHGNIYRTDAYFIAKNLAELPQYLLLPIIYSNIVFWMSGMMHTIQQYFLFVLTCMTITNVATSVGYAAACVFGSQDIAIQILPLITIPLMVFGGFFINLDTIPPYFYPFKFISWHRYGFESFMINLWENVNVTTCQPGECVQGESGADILKFHSFETGAVIIARNIGILICMILVFRMIALTALFLRARFMR